METTVKEKKKKMPKTTVAFLIFALAIPVINWLVFYVYCNASSFIMAFTNSKGELSVDNFIRFFEEFSMPTSVIREAFRNTFITFALLVVTYPLKVLVSFFIYKKIPFYGFYRIVFFLPSIIFGVAISFVFENIVGVRGFIAQWLGEWLNLGYTPELLADSQFANATVLFHLMWLTFPGDLIIWGGTFARIPEEVLESARVDGVNWWTEFTKIVVPLVWPTVALQVVLMFCGIFSASGSVFLLTEGQYGTMTLSAWMYLQVYNVSSAGGQLNSNAYNYLSAVGMIITVVAITISLFIRKYTDKAFADVDF